MNVSITNPAVSDLYAIEFYERWLVRLYYSNSLSYAGKQINNREFMGNNRDYVGANFLYNQAFSKKRRRLAALLRCRINLYEPEGSGLFRQDYQGRLRLYLPPGSGRGSDMSAED